MVKSDYVVIEPPSPSFKSLSPVFLLSLVAAADDAVVLPSLWRYLQYLGASYDTYGTCMVAYYVARILAMPLCGFLCDRFPYRQVVLSLLPFQCLEAKKSAFFCIVCIHYYMPLT